MIKKLRSWKRRFWCANHHELVKNQLCIAQYGTSKYINGEITPGVTYEVWSMKCGRCE